MSGPPDDQSPLLLASKPKSTTNTERTVPADADDFVRLSDGDCHYRFDGPADGPTILLIHGATVPAWEFDRFVPYLTDAGFRTLRADLFGHGYSDRPRSAYDHALFVRQILELLEVLGLDEPVDLVGHSLGAAIAARLACEQPDRFGRLMLAAPLVDYIANQPYTRILKLPLVGEVIVPTYVLPMLVRRRTRRYRTIEDGRFVGKFKRQLSIPGFGRALLSLVRSGSLDDQRATYRALGEQPHPVVILRGEEDGIVSEQQIQIIRDEVPQATYHRLGNTAHAFLLTDPDKVAPIAVDFLGAPCKCGTNRADR